MVVATMSSPPTPPPLTPPPRPTIPRSRPPRPHSQPSPAILSPPGRPNNPHHSASNPVTSTSASTSTESSSSSSRPNPVTPATSHSHSFGPPLHPLQRSAKTQPSTASSTTSVNGLAQSQVGLGIMATPQTGASKMAAAAKRGQAGLDGMSGKGKGPEEEDHPLSEKSLKARDYQTIHTLNRLFHLPTRWQLLRPLGQGAYGLVISVQDKLSGAPVAVKCITRVFDKPFLARRALREITLLRHFGDHENLTGLIDLDYVWEGYNEIYLYMEPMEADLHQIVRSGQPLSNPHIQFFLYQLLRGMKYIHSANVIHRDLKPGNLLVNADCELKICDFGLARGFQPVTGEGDQNEELKLTEYVATRWYRAPEVMLSNKRYTTAIDVWSIGCILGELLGGKPMFKGKDYVDQLNLILEGLGTPDDETLEKIASEKTIAYIHSLPHSDPKPFPEILPDSDPDGRSYICALADKLALELLTHLLTFDPSARYTVLEALEHPYVAAYHDPADEPTCPELFSKWREVESLDTIEELRDAITREIDGFRSEVRDVDVEEWDEGDSSKGTEDVPAPVESQTESTASTQPDTTHHVRLSPKTALIGIGEPPRQPAARSPSTPGTALSEESFGAPSARLSRRTSGHSMHSRRPTSFLFSSPLGAGMTPMLPANSTSNKPVPSQNDDIGPISSGLWQGRRSRAPSSTSWASSNGVGSITSTTGGVGGGATGSGVEVTSLRPLIRQLSTVGLSDLKRDEGDDIEAMTSPGGKDSVIGLGSGLGHVPDPKKQHQRREEEGAGNKQKSIIDGKDRTGTGIPPMDVSPSDAPPSEKPTGFQA
ncbi:kinase-like domain-containing protein [Naematelia encephala]|uniref:Mitogen-activated protein kinase n=1 Tax=Naematelia encephala TaxID=71784 RepID=A0A1Y2BH52_9TREE|nr:kinase-like domain-containing protein [Naematelia encephala]